VTKIYQAFWGRKFLIPAEYDIMVHFAPIANSPDSMFGTVKEGMFRLRAKY